MIWDLASILQLFCTFSNFRYQLFFGPAQAGPSGSSWLVGLKAKVGTCYGVVQVMTLGDNFSQLPQCAGSYFWNNFFQLVILLNQLFAGLSPTFPDFLHLANNFFMQCGANQHYSL